MKSLLLKIDDHQCDLAWSKEYRALRENYEDDLNGLLCLCCARSVVLGRIKLNQKVAEPV